LARLKFVVAFPFDVLSSATRMTNGTRYAEQIRVRLPDGTRQTVTVHVAPDEEVLRHISSVVGAIFTVRGVRFKVTSKYPFQVKKLPPKITSAVEEAEPPPVVEEETAPPVVEEVAAPPVVEDVQVNAVEEPVPPAPRESAPKSERRNAAVVLPAVGERWRPKDPRRKADFTVMEIIPEHDLVITSDNRKIQLSRFKRYERIEEPKAQVS
jgi:hypothetical protein